MLLAREKSRDYNRPPRFLTLGDRNIPIDNEPRATLLDDDIIQDNFAYITGFAIMGKIENPDFTLHFKEVEPVEGQKVKLHFFIPNS